MKGVVKKGGIRVLFFLQFLKCKGKTMDETSIKIISDETFEEVIQGGPVLIDFYADWCGPCRMIAPVLEKLAGEMQGEVLFAKIDIDSSPKAPAECQVTSVPTLILFKEGKELGRFVGLKDESGLKSFLSEHLPA